MSDVFAGLFRLFLTPVGLPVLAALDSTIIFFFPFGLDLALVLVTARNTSLAWLYPLIATAGSVVGAAATYWLGRKIGEHGVERFVDSRRVERVKKRIGHKTAISSGFLAVIPPPFPFTPFILIAGALDVSFRRFILAFAAARVIRLGAISWLAVIYGRQIVGWMESDAFEMIVGAFIVMALTGTAYSAWHVIRASRKTRHATV
jgi:membrane protein YqaA with SNARE-associated domain